MAQIAILAACFVGCGILLLVSFLILEARGFADPLALLCAIAALIVCALLVFVAHEFTAAP
jgi:hypothetical protein